MDPSSAFAISAAGMRFERARADVAAQNIANLHVSADPRTGSVYKPMRVLARPAGTPAAGEFTGALAAAQAVGPEVLIESMEVAPRQVAEPGHPHADAQGMVSYPAVDQLSETVTMMTAVRAYEANIAALNAGKTMALKALDIGKSA